MKEIIQLHENRMGYTNRVCLPRRMNTSHSHNELELNLVLSGRSSYLLNNRCYSLDPHTLVWLFPEQEHALLDSSPDFEMWILIFRPELVSQISSDSPYHILGKANPAGNYFKRISPKHTEQLDQLFSNLAARENNSTLFNAGLAYALSLSWSIYCETTEVPPSVGVHPAVENAVRLLRKNPEIDNLTALADKAGLSPARLSRLFKGQIGMSIIHFRNRLRIEHFLNLYGNGQRKNIMQTAIEAGFGSYPQFHREFTRIMGYGPADYQRRVTNFN